MPLNPSSHNHEKSIINFAGADHISFDTRQFDPASDEIAALCRFFSIGELRHYEKEKGVTLSHSNFFVYAETEHGAYALKFYPENSADNINTEYALNRFLTNRRFLTPRMHASRDGKPFLPCAGRLAACYSYIDGQHAYEKIEDPEIISSINSSILSLKENLAMINGSIGLQEAESFIQKINTLARTSLGLTPYNEAELINSSLKDAHTTFQSHKNLFSRRQLHNNTHLGNFLIQENSVYTIDLAHICEDYILADLSSLVRSCLSLQIHEKTIKMIVQDYFMQNKIKPEYSAVLVTLVKIELIKDYLLCISRLKKAETLTPTDFLKSYQSRLSADMQSIRGSLLPKAFDYLT